MSSRVLTDRPEHINIAPNGGSSSGRTAGSGPVNRGSNPRPPAIGQTDPSYRVAPLFILFCYSVGKA